MQSARIRIAAFLMIAMLAVAQSLEADDWPQFGGPNRDFSVSSTRFAEKWPGLGPPVLWTRPLGAGYSGIVVDPSRVYTIYHENQDDIVIALSRSTGQTLWTHRYAEPFKGEGYGGGPNATPLLVNGRLFTLGGGGKFFCLDCSSGSVLWVHDLVTEFGAEVPWHGFSSSPIAFEDTIILPVGGKDGAGVVAFHQSDGRVVWMEHALMLGYSSPALIDVAGQLQLILYNKNNIMGLDPCTGAEQWEVVHRHVPQHNAALMPLWCPGDILWTSVRTAGEGDGSRAFRLRRTGDRTDVEELYWKSETGAEPYANAVRIGDCVYTSVGHDRHARVVAMDYRTGDVLWEHRGIGTANMINAGGRLVILGEHGALLLAQPTREGLNFQCAAMLKTDRTWTSPSLAGTQLFVRDQARISALELGELVGQPAPVGMRKPLPIVGILKTLIGTLVLVGGVILWRRMS